MGKHVLIIITETNKKECSELRVHVVRIDTVDILNPVYRNYENHFSGAKVRSQGYS